MKILLVDDEIVALNALKKRVDWVKYGFTEVFTAQDVRAASEVVEKERIDLILCDVEMPGGNGLGFIRQVRETHPRIRSVIITCHAEFDYVQTAIRCGARDYILKPIDYEELESLLLQLAEEILAEESRGKIDRLVERTRVLKAADGGADTADTDSNERRLARVKAYIEEHIQEKIAVKDLAELVHINDQYLMRIFKRETGQSILEYITDRRIILASSMLKDTDYSINFIADCVGCDNYSYFTKLFKKQTGFTPREYRGQFKSE